MQEGIRLCQISDGALTEVTFDFWFQMDMLVEPVSDAISHIDGTETKNTWKWSGSDIPTEMIVDNYMKLGSINTMVNISSNEKVSHKLLFNCGIP